MQKLVGKLAQLGEGAPWIFKLMSHLYKSLAFSLKSNSKLLEKSSSGFRSLVKQIKTKNFTGKQSDYQRHLNSLTAKSVPAGTKLILFGRYVLNIYVGIVQYFLRKTKTWRTKIYLPTQRTNW
jgi:hypothetical protein